MGVSNTCPGTKPVCPTHTHLSEEGVAGVEGQAEFEAPETPISHSLSLSLSLSLPLTLTLAPTLSL